MNETMMVTKEEKRLIEMLRESSIDWLTVCRALDEYCRGLAENTYFAIISDPEDYAANEARFDLMERALSERVRLDKLINPV